MNYECYADMNVLKFGVGEMEEDTQCFGIDSVVGIYHCKYFSSWNNWEYSHQPGQTNCRQVRNGPLAFTNRSPPCRNIVQQISTRTNRHSRLISNSVTHLLLMLANYVSF